MLINGILDTLICCEESEEWQIKLLTNVRKYFLYE